MAGRRAESLLLALLAVLNCCSGLYDPVHRIASARIYGNIDAFAYYFVDLIIGTPPQRVSVIVDTGSGVTAFPCKSCQHCGQHMDPAFDFPRSSSAKWTPCGGGCAGSCRGNHCAYHQGYTEGSSISGWWFQDMVRLGDTIQRNPAVRANLGCHQDENKLFYTQKANGIMGIRPPGRGTATVLQELFADHAHIDGNVFSLCLAEWGGRIVVGGHNASYHTGSITYIPLATGSGYYGVPLTAIRVDGQEVATHFGSTMIDSGTTYVYMASQPYRSLRGAIESYCNRHANCGARLLGTCWEIPDEHAGLRRFPNVQVEFQGMKTSWVPGGYLFRKGSTKRWCYAFEDDGPRANTVLGAAWMLHQDVIFDLRNARVGIAQAKCPEFQKRPHHDSNADLSLPTVPPAKPQAQQQYSASPIAASTPGPPRDTQTSAPTIQPSQRPTSYEVTPIATTAEEEMTTEFPLLNYPLRFAGAGVTGVVFLTMFCAWAIRRCKKKAGQVNQQQPVEFGQGVSPVVMGIEMNGKDGVAELSDEEDPLVAAIQEDR